MVDVILLLVIGILTLVIGFLVQKNTDLDWHHL